MRVFIAVLVLIFGFQSLTKADDIRDFEIEGFSIGDSLLDHFSEEDIKNNIAKKYYTYIKKDPKKFLGVEFSNLTSLKDYEAIQFSIKKNDKKYKIFMVKGMIDYSNNINDCYKKMDEVNNELSKLFKNLDKEIFKQKHEADESGKSIVDSIVYWFPQNDLIEIECYDWSEEKGYIDHLRIGATSKEFNEWLIEK